MCEKIRIADAMNLNRYSIATKWRSNGHAPRAAGTVGILRSTGPDLQLIFQGEHPRLSRRSLC
jgi:hypothetical protein